MRARRICRRSPGRAGTARRPPAPRCSRRSRARPGGASQGMGREATCRARLAPTPRGKPGPPAEGKALLETDDVVFRGEFRARVPLREIEAVVVKAGLLALSWPGGRLEL